MSDQSPLNSRNEMRIAHHYEGVIPPPHMMVEYAKIDPSLPDRIFAMAEREQAHRLQMDVKVEARSGKLADGVIVGMRIGTASAMASLILCLGGCIWMALTGHDTVAGILGGSSLLGVVGFFLKAPKTENHSRE